MLGTLAAVTSTLWLGTAADCLGDTSCNANCDIEVECGFRSLEACEAASCDVVTGAVVHTGLDACLAAAADCLEAAACACDDGCDKTAECTESPDANCVSTCDTLVEQEPKETYLENVCKLGASCEEQATCGGVSG